MKAIVLLVNILLFVVLYLITIPSYISGARLPDGKLTGWWIAQNGLVS